MRTTTTAIANGSVAAVALLTGESATVTETEKAIVKENAIEMDETVDAIEPRIDPRDTSVTKTTRVCIALYYSRVLQQLSSTFSFPLAAFGVQEHEKTVRTLFVKNMPVKATEKDIEAFFGNLGYKVRDVQLIKDKMKKSKGSVSSRGFAFSFGECMIRICAQPF